MKTERLTKKEARQKAAEIEPLLEEVRAAQEQYQEAKDELDCALANLTYALFGEPSDIDADNVDRLIDEQDTAETLVEDHFEIAETEDERRQLPLSCESAPRYISHAPRLWPKKPTNWSQREFFGRNRKERSSNGVRNGGRDTPAISSRQPYCRSSHSERKCRGRHLLLSG